MPVENQPRWSAATDAVLRKSGWYPGRSVPTDTWEAILREHGGFEMHKAARRFLAEFGALVNDGWPPGPVTAQSPFRLDPLTAEWDAETFARLSQRAGVSLYPIGQANRRTSHLAIAPSGAVYLAPLGEDTVQLLADAPGEALNKLVETRCFNVPLPLVAAESTPARDPHGQRVEGGNSDQRWTATTDRVLRAAGWYPGRSVPTGTWEAILLEHDRFEIHDAARCFLTEFGGLAFAPGKPVEASSWMEFRFDPLLAKWDAEIFEVLGEQTGEPRLYPLGMANGRNQYLAMTPNGVIYRGMDYAELLANTPEGALRALIGRGD
ncbi:SUKH-3 domain-containing protein [Streptomyces sp. NPDC058989]|uniref:SUKH-3 domain-containing protein n=1 Tax=Streptomyces sp. NPDC058989 TaxID=3346686 RepID=UPI0036BB15DE